MIKTRLTERLGIQHPVVLGGMASGTNVDLVVAVSEAGGLGILGVTSFSPEQIREAAAEIRSRTKRPFGLNLLIAFTNEAQLEACLAARVPVLSTAWGDPQRHAARAQETLRAGANDLGGTLMNESISRAAGAAHGQELDPPRMEALIRELGRVPQQRTTLYGPASAERHACGWDAPPLAAPVNAAVTGRMLNPA